MPAIDSSTIPGADVVSSLLHTKVGTVLQTRGLTVHHGSSVKWTRPPWSNRSVYIAISAISLLITAYLFYRRCHRLTLKQLRGITYIRFLVILSYVLAMSFVITSLIFTTNGISSLSKCRNAIYFCIGFLFAGKISLQLFLIERAHVANITYLRRRDDPIWWISMIALAILGSTCLVWTYINPVYYMDKEDGRCRKGLPPNVVGPIQATEILLNVLLTIVFIRMLKRSRMCELFARDPEKICHIRESFKWVGEKMRVFKFKKTTEEEVPGRVGERAIGSTATTDSTASTLVPVDTKLAKASESIEIGDILPASTRPSRLRNLAWKSLIGTLLVLGWTITNNVIFYSTRGRENAWMCFTQCNLDVVLSVWVLHWLTSDPKDDDRWTRNSVTELPTFGEEEEAVVGPNPTESGRYRDRGDSIISVSFQYAKKAYFIVKN